MRDCVPSGVVTRTIAPIAIAIRFRPLQMQSKRAIPVGHIVAIKISRSLIRRDQQIEIAIAIEIAIRQRAPHLRRGKASAHLVRDIVKTPVAAVQEQMRRLRVTVIPGDIANRFVDVPVDRREIEMPIQIHIEKRAPEAEAHARRRADAGLRRHILETALAAGPIDRHHLFVEVGDRDAHDARIVEIGRIDAHTGARLAVFAESHAGLHGDILERSVALIAIELVRLRIVRDEKIRPAVAIVIEHRDAERFRRGVEDSALRRHVLKRAVAAIVKEPAGGTMERLGRAVGLVLSIHAAEHIMLGRPLHVVADEQIEQAIAIVIEPQRGCAQAAAAAQPGLVRDVDERAFAGVLKEPVLPDAGDQNIGETVVVVIRHGHAQAVHLDCEPGAPRHIRERAVAIVAVERERRRPRAYGPATRCRSPAEYRASHRHRNR